MRASGNLKSACLMREQVAGVLLAGLGLVAALGVIGTTRATGTARGLLPAPVCEPKTHKQQDQKNYRGDVVFHNIDSGRPVAAMGRL